MDFKFNLPNDALYFSSIHVYANVGIWISILLSPDTIHAEKSVK